MNRTDIINFLIEKYDFKNYLEVGVQFPESNYDKIKCEKKTGIEPFPVGEWANKNIMPVTSDAWFADLKETYDIVFIDGLHTREQCLADIFNSLNHLSDNGFILVHDCLPTEEYQISREDNHREWTGDVFKSIVDIRTKDNLDVCTIDTDWGIGCIRKDNTKLGKVNEIELTWDNYFFFKHELLNIKSVDEWINSL